MMQAYHCRRCLQRIWPMNQSLVHGSGSPASIYGQSPSRASSAETRIFGPPTAQRGYPMLKDLGNMGYLTIFNEYGLFNNL